MTQVQSSSMRYLMNIIVLFSEFWGIISSNCLRLQQLLQTYSVGKAKLIYNSIQYGRSCYFLAKVFLEIMILEFSSISYLKSVKMAHTFDPLYVQKNGNKKLQISAILSISGRILSRSFMLCFWPTFFQRIGEYHIFSIVLLYLLKHHILIITFRILQYWNGI